MTGTIIKTGAKVAILDRKISDNGDLMYLIAREGAAIASGYVLASKVAL